MSKRQAIQILMMSPIYFKLPLVQRQELVEDFLQMQWSVKNGPYVNQLLAANACNQN